MRLPRQASLQPKELDNLVPVVRKLEKLVEQCRLEPHIAKECLGFLKGAERALQIKDSNEVINQIDLFVLAIQRNMGTEISLRKAFELVDVAIIDVKRYVADPAQIFTEARAFAVKFIQVASASDTRLNLVARPIPPGVKTTQQIMKKAIQSYNLPTDAERRLMQLTDQMAKIALAHNPKDQLRFFTALTEFHSILTSLAGTYISTTQVNYLMGLVIFGWPAWLCVTPFSWIVQAVAVGLGLIIFGIMYLYRCTAAQTAGKNVQLFITGGIKGTPPPLEEVPGKVKEFVEDLSREDREDVKKSLQEALNGPEAEADEELRQRLQKAIEAIDEVLQGGG